MDRSLPIVSVAVAAIMAVLSITAAHASTSISCGLKGTIVSAPEEQRLYLRDDTEQSSVTFRMMIDHVNGSSRSDIQCGADRRFKPGDVIEVTLGNIHLEAGKGEPVHVVYRYKDNETSSHTWFEIAPFPVPKAITMFFERQEGCDHFAGEEAYDKPRGREIERAMRKLRCARIDADKAALSRTYAARPEVMRILWPATRGKPPAP